MMLRKFGFKKHEPRESDARLKLQKELFAHNRCVEHGFPHKPSALAYDNKLKLLAIGTKNGDIRIVGAPGVEFSAQHESDVSVSQLHFLPDQGRLISLCGDNSLHLWELNVKENKDVSVLEEVKKFQMEASQLKMISACCVTSDAETMLLGTEGGNVHLLDVPTFTLKDQVIYQDVVMQNVPEDFRLNNPGAVEAITQHPTDPNKFLIGYNRGLIVLWDNKETNADQTYNATQQLESICWHRDGTQFMSAHADGSYIVWATNDSTRPKEQPNTPYGPFPCKSINKVQWKAAKADNFIVFSGGMPRPSYADRHTVSVMQGAKQVVFDFTSRVVDFLVLSNADETDDLQHGEYDDPYAIIVLVEEELVAIDLKSENWPTFRQPYLCSPHSSAMTCAHHAASVPEVFWKKLQEAGASQSAHYSSSDWPITGGKINNQQPSNRDVLITGHEDGTVRFWDASSVAMRLIYKLSTAAFFGLDFGEQSNDGEEEWPPFRKVGTFDPYSDDPRLGIQKIALCPISETLVIGGTAGQVVVLHFEREERETEIKAQTVSIVSDREAFIWKGHDALKVSEGDMKFAGGFHPSCVMQMYPPAACTALALHSDWQVVAAGTAHGLALFDYSQKREVSTKCTLNPSDMTGTGDSAMARRKSFKKSLRESFRRLRKRRSERRKKADEQHAEEKREEAARSGDEHAEAPAEGAAEGGDGDKGDSTAVSPTQTPPATTPSTPPEGTRTIERAIEARSTDDTMASMVRCLYFADTYLINNTTHTPTMWAGTNAGNVYIFQITMPAEDKRDQEALSCQLGKEIRLKHRAPVVNICILDKTARPLPAPLEVKHQLARAPDMTGHHQVVICSEEQFKIFSLPSVKPQNKYKLTAHEGSKVRKISFTNFRSRSASFEEESPHDITAEDEVFYNPDIAAPAPDVPEAVPEEGAAAEGAAADIKDTKPDNEDENYCETDMVVLTNQGDIQVFSMPNLRRQLKADTIRRDNVYGIVSCVLTTDGEGFYPSCPSEFSRFSVSARVINSPRCMVELKEGMRPAVAEPVQEEVVQEAAAETEVTPAVETEPQQQPDTTPAEGGAAEGDRADEQAPAEGANDSAAPGDLTADLTIDSVKVHLSDENSTREVVNTQSSVSMTRTVVTRTIVSESTDEGTRVVTTQETHTLTSGDNNGEAAVAVEAAGGEE